MIYLFGLIHIFCGLYLLYRERVSQNNKKFIKDNIVEYYDKYACFYEEENEFMNSWDCELEGKNDRKAN